MKLKLAAAFILICSTALLAQQAPVPVVRPNKAYLSRLHRYKRIQEEMAKLQSESRELGWWLIVNTPNGHTIDQGLELFIVRPPDPAPAAK